MIISVASGKGGTGKTSVAVNLALLWAEDKNIQFLDCDVEEPNANIFLKCPLDKKEKLNLLKPVIDSDKCIYCQKCAQVCIYNAIAIVSPRPPQTKGKALVFYELCHSCGACSLVCPVGAITETEVEKGVVEEGQCGNIHFIRGLLRESESSPTPLVKAVKKKIDPRKDVIIDASPGTSCPVVEAVEGSDYTVLVTEPTPFGLHDLRLAVEMCRGLKIKFGVVINRSDLGGRQVYDYLKKEEITLLSEIPFSHELAYRYSQGKTFVDLAELKEIFVALKEKIEAEV